MSHQHLILSRRRANSDDPFELSPLVPGLCWFGGSKTPAAVPAPPPPTPAPPHASAPTQSVAQILMQSRPRLGRESTLLTANSNTYTTEQGRRTILGLPIRPPS